MERIGRVIREDGVVEALPNVFPGRFSTPLERVHSVLEPSFCVIAQGSKEVLLGDSCYRYDATNYLIATLELPRISRVLEASPERPYLGFRLELAPPSSALCWSSLVRPRWRAVPTSGRSRAARWTPIYWLRWCGSSDWWMRQMLGDGLDAAGAAYRVGYRPASHGNREYKSLFGDPPERDAERLRVAAREGAGPV